MKNLEQIQERINKLKKRLSLTAKHHDNLTGSRMCRYKSKYIELYEIWREMTYYKKGLEWVLDVNIN